MLCCHKLSSYPPLDLLNSSILILMWLTRHILLSDVADELMAEVHWMLDIADEVHWLLDVADKVQWLSDMTAVDESLVCAWMFGFVYHLPSSSGGTQIWKNISAFQTHLFQTPKSLTTCSMKWPDFSSLVNIHTQKSQYSTARTNNCILTW